MSQTSIQTFNITRTLQKIISRYLAGDDDNDDGYDKDDDKGGTFNQKADDDVEDFDDGCLISRKRNFPLLYSYETAFLLKNS